MLELYGQLTGEMEKDCSRPKSRYLLLEYLDKLDVAAEGYESLIKGFPLLESGSEKPIFIDIALKYARRYKVNNRELRKPTEEATDVSQTEDISDQPEPEQEATEAEKKEEPKRRGWFW